MSWEGLGRVDPRALVDARLQLHHAAQILATAGTTFLEKTADDSHPNAGWSDSHAALLGRTIPGPEIGIGLRPATLELLCIDSRGRSVDVFALEGRGLEDGYAWLERTCREAGAEPVEGALVRAGYEIPDHAVADGAPLSLGAEPEAFAELGRWLADGFAILTRWAERLENASEARCWPHHFDVGLLQVVATDASGALAKSVGLGLSPGDESYAEPYWYVSPWPAPEPDSLPPLGADGGWHTEGFTAAVLVGSDLVAMPAETQAERLDHFLETAVDASRHVLLG